LAISAALRQIIVYFGNAGGNTQAVFVGAGHRWKMSSLSIAVSSMETTANSQNVGRPAPAAGRAAEDFLKSNRRR